MSRLLPRARVAALILVCLGALGMGVARSPAQPEAGEGGAVPPPQPAALPRFVPVDIMIDPKGHVLGAYQIEVIAAEGVVATLVGVEGGNGAYGRAPYYDPAALHGGAIERVVIAGIASGEQGDAPTGPGSEVRVARLHYMVEGDVEAGAALLRATLIVAGENERTPIEVGVRLVEVEGGT